MMSAFKQQRRWLIRLAALSLTSFSPADMVSKAAKYVILLASWYQQFGPDCESHGWRSARCCYCVI